MKRKPTTNPQINGKPLSFVKIGSRVAGDYSYKRTNFTDSRNVPYRRLPSGQIVGYPQPMCEVKAKARQSRLQRRANFRIAKQFAAITEEV